MYIYIYTYIYIYIYIYIHICAHHLPGEVEAGGSQSSSWLMSVTFFASALEVLREFRWWFPLSSPGCSISALILGAIAIGTCCFWTGFLLACCLVSARCRHWLWHCAASAAVLLQDLPVARGPVEPRARFREYRSA